MYYIHVFNLTTNDDDDDDFTSTLHLIRDTLPTPPLVSSNVGKTVPTSKLRSVFGGDNYVYLQCNDKKYMIGVYTCWAHDIQYTIQQIPCPLDVIKEDSCTGPEVEIVGFGSRHS